MFLAPEGGELEIASAAAAFLAAAMPIDRLHGPAPADMDAALRLKIGEMGWFALALPEDAGGSGLTAVEFVLFFHEVGRQCGPVDVLAHCLAAMTTSDPSLRAAIVNGAAGVALAVPDAGSVRILGSPEATLVVQVHPGRSDLFEMPRLAVSARNSLDPATSMRVTPSLPGPVASTQTTHVWTMGQLGAAAMLVGIAQEALSQIVAYASIRETFGKKIGSWQAVRHPCADMAIRVEAARSQLWFAAAAHKEGRTDTATHLNAAKHLANLAAVSNADTNIQLHGGIGVTEEHHAHLFLKHALVLSRLFGAKRDLLDRLLHATVEA